MFSYIARAEYKFMNRYLLTGTFRADGSSRFAPKYRWGKFPSVAAAWIVSEEDFLRESNIFTFLKLRGGWGKTGNAYVSMAGEHFMKMRTMRISLPPGLHKSGMTV